MIEEVDMAPLEINNQYRCKYFKIEELVHPNLLKTIPEDILWSMFDDRLLRVADRYRENYGPIFINGRGLVDCGLREIDSKTGAKYSAHKFGRALDLHIISIENLNLPKEEKIERYNRVRKEYIYADINYEDNISWLHIDTYNRANKFFKG